ncbi:hypothetical protein [Pseudomonas protegens]
MSNSIDTSTWLQEFTPLVEKDKVRWPDVKLELMKGEACTVGLDYEYSWLIGTDEGFLALECKSGTGRGLIFDPPLGQECEMAEGTTSLKWCISSDQAELGPFELQFALPKYPHLSKSPELPGRLINNWSDGFTLLIDGRPVDWTEVKLDLMTGQTCILTLSYEGNILIGDPEGALALEYKSGTADRGLVFDPPLGQSCEMAQGTTSLSWVITSDQAYGGPFELQFALPNIPQSSKSPLLPGRLIENWSDGFTLLINSERVEWSDVNLNLMAGDTCTLTLNYERNGLIGDPRGYLALEYKPGAEAKGLVFDPPLDALVEMAKGTTSLTWTLSANEADSSDFALQFSMPLFDRIPESPSIALAVLNVATELEITFDEMTINFGETAYPCHGAVHQLTLLPVPGSRLLNKSLRLVRGGESLGEDIKPSLSQDHVLTVDGLTWTLDCLKTTQNGVFYLQLMLGEWEREFWKINVHLGHNLVTAEHWSKVVQWGHGEVRETGVRATSAFLKSPASGVRVTIQHPGADEPRYGTTDLSGEVIERSALDVHLKLSISNPYNGTIV